MGCIPKKQEKHQKNMREFAEYFDRQLGKYYGKTLGKNSTSNGRETVEDLFRHWLKRPFHFMWDDVAPADWQRARDEVDLEKNRFENKTISTVSTIVKVPSSHLRKTQASRKWSNEMDQAAGYENDKFAKYTDAKTFMALNIKAALIDEGFLPKGKKGKRLLEKVSEIEQKVTMELLNGNEAAASRYYNQLKEMLKNSKVLEDIVTILQDPTAFKDGQLRSDYSVYRTDEQGNKRRISDHTFSAAKRARQVLDMGADIAIRGLEKLEQNLTIVLRDELGVSDQKMKDNIKKAISSIREGKNEGSYFPHYLLDILPKIHTEMDIFHNNERSRQERENSLRELGRLSLQLGAPSATKARKVNFNEMYRVNPIGVIERYMSEVISFNKIQHLQNSYIKTMKNLPRGKDAGAYAEALRKYINDRYLTATIGYKNRPDWVNKTTRLIGSYETVSKLGFGIPTAGRNVFSGMYFLSEIGITEYFRSRKNIRQNPELRKELDAAEKEQGYLFNQVLSPIFTEGLLPTKGIRSQDIEFNIRTNKFEIKTDKGWQVLDNIIDKTVEKSMVLQRVTENWLRKEMFRTGFEQWWRMLSSNQGYLSTVGMTKIRKQATNAAIQLVGRHAFGYEIQDKAPIVGGTYKPAGALGQVLMHFMHWPMKFADLQVNIYRNAGMAIKAGQYKSNEVYTAARFASIYMLTGIFSALLNADLTHVAENDTVRRTKDLFDYMVADDEEEREKIMYGRGPVQSFMGPFLSDLILAGNIFGVYNMPDNEWAKILLGYQDIYDQEEDQRMRRSLTLVNVELSRWATKHADSFREGRGSRIPLDEFNIYPRSWTRKGHEMIFGKPEKKKKKKKTDAEEEMNKLILQLSSKKVTP